MTAEVTLHLRLAWWFRPLVWALAPLGLIGLRLPAKWITGIAARAVKIEER